MSQIDLQQITLDDALNDPDPLSFDAPPRLAVLTTRITCRVCDRHEDVPILSSGLLCSLCRTDLAATERHIRETLALAEQALDDASTRWDADYAHATEEDREWYGKVCAIRATVSDAEYEQRHAAALDRGAPPGATSKAKAHASLLRSAAAYETAIKMMEEKRRWADTALTEVEAARDAD